MYVGDVLVFIPACPLELLDAAVVVCAAGLVEVVLDEACGVADEVRCWGRVERFKAANSLRNALTSAVARSCFCREVSRSFRRSCIDPSTADLTRLAMSLACWLWGL